MTWSIAAVAFLSVTLLALNRARQTARTSGSPSTAPRDQTSEAVAAGASLQAVEPEQGPVRSCPVCLSEYAPKNRFCVRDGAPLTDGLSSGPFSHGMICPTCRRGYPSDASFCPEDADELVPYGLYGAASSTRHPLGLDSHKICPECGVRHAAAHLFCGQDGAELVVVN